jgi:hypothetical protein
MGAAGAAGAEEDSEVEGVVEEAGALVAAVQEDDWH